MKKKFLLWSLVALVVIAAVGVTTASLVSSRTASPGPDQGVTVSPSPTCVRSCQTAPQANHTGPASLAPDKESERAGLDAAVKVMASYTDTGKPQAAWFKALAPQLTTAYAEDAQYIQPSRLPVRKVTGTPSVVPAAVPDGHQLRVRFPTNAGEWVVVMTRASEGAPWLAASVLPAKDAL